MLTLKVSTEQVSFADFDPTGERVITASSDGTVRFWDASSGEMLRLLQGPAEGTGSVRWRLCARTVCSW